MEGPWCGLDSLSLFDLGFRQQAGDDGKDGWNV